MKCENKNLTEFFLSLRLGLRREGLTQLTLTTTSMTQLQWST